MSQPETLLVSIPVKGWLPSHPAFTSWWPVAGPHQADVGSFVEDGNSLAEPELRTSWNPTLLTALTSGEPVAFFHSSTGLGLRTGRLLVLRMTSF